jgi:hypothetical protein
MTDVTIFKALSRWFWYGPKPPGWPHPEQSPADGEWRDPGHDTGYCHCGKFHD